MATKKMIKFQPLHEIATIIKNDWKDVNFGAKPYLNAMATLDKISDSYGSDSGRSIVAYFLSNASTWRGDVARETKKTLNTMLR